MALFTGKGDSGMTKLFGGNLPAGQAGQRISKSSTVAEALGSLDEINSFLGLCKVQSAYLDYKLDDQKISDIVHEMQKNLFIVQAEVAGADKKIDRKKVGEIEDAINAIEKKLPPIKSFFISGGPAEVSKGGLSGAGLGSLFDIARTIARRAERRVVAVNEEYLNKSLFDQENRGSEEDKKDTDAPVVLDARAGQICENTLAYLNRLSSALYALARFSNHLAGIEEEAPDYR
jgi:cob(I)alamin adenosyltransferase